jgi:hypothetical protein
VWQTGRRESVELMGDGADGRDHEVVGEHGGNGDQEANHRRDEGPGDARSHGGQARGVGPGDAGEGFHDAPDRAQKADERTSRHGGRENNHSFLEGESGGGGLLFEAGFNGLEGPHGDPLVAAGGDGAVLEMEFEFLGSSEIDPPSRSPGKGVAPALQIQRVAGLVVSGEESFGFRPRPPELAGFGDYDGPTEQGKGQQDADRYLAFHRCFLESELEGSGGERWR